MNRVELLALLKRSGVSKLSDRQALANALARYQLHMALSVPASLREVVPLIVSMNVHESPAFLRTQLAHIRDQLPCDHRVVLNCNRFMYNALALP